MPERPKQHEFQFEFTEQNSPQTPNSGDSETTRDSTPSPIAAGRSEKTDYANMSTDELKEAYKKEFGAGTGFMSREEIIDALKNPNQHRLVALDENQQDRNNRNN